MRLTGLSEDQVKTRTRLKQMPFPQGGHGQHNYTPFEAFLVCLTHEITHRGHHLKDASCHVAKATALLAAGWPKIHSASRDFLYLKAKATPNDVSFAGDCLFGIMHVFDMEVGQGSGSVASRYFLGTAAEIFRDAQHAILAPYIDSTKALGDLRLESLIIVNATTAWRQVQAHAEPIKNQGKWNVGRIDLTNVFGDG